MNTPLSTTLWSFDLGKASIGEAVRAAKSPPQEAMQP